MEELYLGVFIMMLLFSLHTDTINPFERNIYLFNLTRVLRIYKDGFLVRRIIYHQRIIT